MYVEGGYRTSYLPHTVFEPSIMFPRKSPSLILEAHPARMKALIAAMNLSTTNMQLRQRLASIQLPIDIVLNRLFPVCPIPISASSRTSSVSAGRQRAIGFGSSIGRWQRRGDVQRRRCRA